MGLGLEKCAKGKLASTGNIVIDDDTEIQELDQEGVYKYLGVDESDGIQHSKMKEKIRKEYNRRVRLILRTELNGRNKIEAINSLAVPVVQYSFGIIDWKISELKKIDTKTRKLLNMHKMLHPKADVERLYIPRKDGGRGLIDVETAFKTATIGLDHYLKHKGQYPMQLLEHERSKAKNPITKNATKFKREVTMPAYVSKYSEAAAYLHWNICKDHDIEITDKWYERKPETVTHNKHNNTIIITVVKDSVNSTCKLIDMTIPSDGNIALKEIGKKSKYKDLELETQRMWHVKTEVTPVVVGVLGTVKKGMVENIKKESERATVTETQTICMLGSAQSSGRCLLYEQND